MLSASVSSAVTHTPDGFGLGGRGACSASPGAPPRVSQHRHVHTVCWFQRPADSGPMCFRSGATLGRQGFLFLCFRPDTAPAAFCIRRFRIRDDFLATACTLLAEAA